MRLLPVGQLCNTQCASWKGVVVKMGNDASKEDRKMCSIKIHLFAIIVIRRVMG